MKPSETPSLWKLLLAPVKPQRLRLFATFLTGLAAQGGTLACLAMGGWLCAQAFSSTDIHQLTISIVVLVVVIIFTALARWAQAWFSHDLAFSLIETLQMGIYDGLERGTPGLTHQQQLGDVAATATSDAGLMERFYAHMLIDYITALVIPFAALLLLGLLHYWLALTLLPFIMMLLIIPGLLSTVASRQGEAIMAEKSQLNSLLVEIIQGWRDVQLFGAQQQFRQQLQQRSTRLNQAQYRYGARSGLEQAILDTLSALAILAQVAIGLWLIAENALKPQLLPYILAVCTGALLPLMDISHASTLWGALRTSASRIFQLQQLPVTVINVGDDVRPASAKIVFHQVNFRYPQQQHDALHDLSFILHPGERVAIAGHSGSGKTTIAHLLLRFYDPDSGRISLGDIDLRDLNLATLRQYIAWVPQESWLFNDSVANNIRLGDPSASQQDVEQAARQAQAEEFILALPQGYDTVCSKGGEGLSGGQRQRIALARALLSKAPIILLDEASSSLDGENEQLIFNALDTLPANRCIITIAHRLSVLQRAERILVLDQGKIVESGSHSCLLAKQGHYAALIAALAVKSTF